MSIFSLFNPAKDFVFEVAVKLWFNQTQKQYGQMTTIRIDSTAKNIHLELELKGESSPLEIDLKNYHLRSEAGETFIELGEIQTSREWIDQLLGAYLPPDKRSFKLPGALKVLL